MDLIIRAPQGSGKGLIIDRLIKKHLGYHMAQVTECHITMQLNVKGIENVRNYIINRLAYNITAFKFEVYDLESAQLWLEELTKLRDELNRDDIHFFLFTDY